MKESFSPSRRLTAFRINSSFCPQLQRRWKSELFTEESTRGRSQFLTWSSTSIFTEKPESPSFLLQEALGLIGLEDQVPPMKRTEKKDGNPGFLKPSGDFLISRSSSWKYGLLIQNLELVRTITWTGNVCHVGMGTKAPEMPRPSPSWPHLRADT